MRAENVPVAICTTSTVTVRGRRCLSGGGDHHANPDTGHAPRDMGHCNRRPQADPLADVR